MLVSKLEEYPHAGTKKYITDIYAMVSNIYQRTIVNEPLPDRKETLTELFINYKNKKGAQKIYNPEVYTNVGYMRNFWSSESIIFVLNNQIGDTTLSIPILLSVLKTGKKISIFTLHIELVKNLLLRQEGIDMSKVSFLERDDINDFQFTDKHYCINLHRTISLENVIPDERYLSLDWRILPLFDEEYYAFPERFALLVEILMGYSTSIHLSSKEIPDTHNYLLVPRSSLHEKELSNNDWLKICEDIRMKDCSCVFYLAFDNPEGEDIDFKYYSLYTLLKSHKFNISILKKKLGELPEVLNDLLPKVISVDTGLAHIAALNGLKTIIISKAGNSKLWSFPISNVTLVNSRLSEFLIRNEYGLFDPFFGNSEVDDNTRPLLLESEIDINSIIKHI